MNEITFAGQRPIDTYGPGGFRVGGVWHEGALILLPGGLLPMPGGALSEAAIASLLAAAAGIDMVLVGQGPEIAPLPRALREAFEAAGIGVEVMSTPSACRTYNVLLAEDRRIAAMLLPIG
ncbi:Mth938-like domain-containing protein [Thermohalobaculum sediminis]|uniref:Mth938-like domain-containing protein n=1 Tax=Thermohalobaculum sediminis TaxID=2939436 RepID=UPI0029E7FEDE|nr:Mth938-like domain-containing protein [Limibaculum sediminis]